ncbi:hypothetical protein CEK29_07180 [Bordetella genomosp. 5]|uniref:HTH cro/C1-type domain-containing protein n=1 Tax=Bordetella genomosp. 5 TaxID=1395608 RepID=A0A261TKJ7_9BORD|nr:S24 family peptidase [Bordetella genomosp. 5]OZI44504.1 hypothetical protein CEK29_07180 [Bordetella genomosp. 5]OZI50166.1 hypothetical protein CAL25_12610 [Bordetella genomosp. 5]
MKSIKEIRRDNLARAIDLRCDGNQTRAALLLGYSTPSLVSRYTTSAKDIGDRAARKMEEVFGLPANWMDTPHEAANGAARDPAGASAAAPIGRAIRHVRMARGMSAEKLADLAGIDAAALAAIEKGATPAPDVLARFAHALEVDTPLLARLSALSFGEVTTALLQQLPPDDLTHTLSEDEVTYVGPYHATRRIPVVGMAQLGENGFYDELEYPAGHGDGYLLFNSKDPNAYVLKVRGDSMKPAIRNGWYIVVEPSGRPTPGEYVVLQLEDGRKMAKELLFQHARTGDIEVMSVNGEIRMSVPGTAVRHVHPIAAVVPPSQIIYS